MKKRVAILYGGKSGEHEVSLQSAYSVVKNLPKDRFQPLLIGLDKKGTWFLQSDPARIADDENRTLSMVCREESVVHAVPGRGLECSGRPIAVDVAFPVLHGPFGEDGTVQGLLEVCGVPYVGAGVLGSSLGMDKDTVKRVWQEAGVPVVPFTVIHRHDIATGNEAGRKEKDAGKTESAAAQWKRLSRRYGTTLFVKPARVGSSVGISRATTQQEFTRALELAFSFDTKVLIEPAITGKEIECSVIGNERLWSFPPGEVVPAHEFYDYKAKYLDPAGAELLIPARITEEAQARVRELAELAYRTADTQGLARVDFFISADEKSIYVNEINTIPGFTKISMFPRMCENGGLPYGELLTRLIDLGLERHRSRSQLSYDYQWS